MRKFVFLGIASLCLCPALAQPSIQSTDKPQIPTQTRPNSELPAPKLPPFPVQLEMRVPIAPTAFPSDGRYYLLYELHLTNFGQAPLPINRIELLDADALEGIPLGTFEAEQLETMVQYVGGKAAANPKGSTVIAGGQSAIIFMMAAFDHESQIPGKVLHQVVIGDFIARGAIITTNSPALRVLGPPLEGEDWLAADGPSNDLDNHHRRGVIVFDGRSVISRRYAIDWKQVRDGVSFSGDSRDVRSYYSYDKPVLAVADGRVVAARDGLPNNIPGHGDAFHPAVPITLDTVAGNTLTLDLGGGQFAYYMHLEPGSVRVKVGDRVKRGKLLARIGCTGDAREPHLHFEVTNSSKPLSGEGIPYLIDRYRSKGTNGVLELRTRELPLGKSVVVFNEGRGK
jgi:murein DD-endopeptidase MepM/ murein hydrolase activator NlpD